VDAVIFDWGGTLTPWKSWDARGTWRRIAAALAQAGALDPSRVDEVADRLFQAEDLVWQRAREQHRSGTLVEVLAAAGLDANETFYAIHDAEHEWATFTDPDAGPLLTALRQRGIRIGVLSNTTWSRAQHERIFLRDNVLHLIDGAVYTCEIDWTKPHPEAFHAAMAAIGATEPSRCVFVGDRPFDDIFGAHQVGMRAVLVPHSDIPLHQRGHTDGEPDAVIHRLSELLSLVDTWSADGLPAFQAEDA
jgi:putative hydrolase of the HAD superfamily